MPTLEKGPGYTPMSSLCNTFLPSGETLIDHTSEKFMYLQLTKWMESRRAREKKANLESIERDYSNDESWIRIVRGPGEEKKQNKYLVNV